FSSQWRTVCPSWYHRGNLTMSRRAFQAGKNISPERHSTTFVVGRNFRYLPVFEAVLASDRAGAGRSAGHRLLVSGGKFQPLVLGLAELAGRRRPQLCLLRCLGGVLLVERRVGKLRIE